MNEIRLIDANALKEAVLENGITDILNLIDNAPTVNDCPNCVYKMNYDYICSSSSYKELQALREFKKENERPQGEWEESHIFSCGNILRMREDVIEHKCKNCGRWSIKWASTIPDNFCSNCGAKMGGGENVKT